MFQLQTEDAACKALHLLRASAASGTAFPRNMRGGSVESLCRKLADSRIPTTFGTGFSLRVLDKRRQQTAQVTGIAISSQHRHFVPGRAKLVCIPCRTEPVRKLHHTALKRRRFRCRACLSSQ
ncbi:unnamed protein product [Symbiodinium natans]|uniref:Uncharacterized protein n=1 Tax=Symbiodinium natans TaxID=878477 RepID=A0A812S4V7_9DINO|nr:unnamed protein product [Symbiodinium natans]